MFDRMSIDTIVEVVASRQYSWEFLIRREKIEQIEVGHMVD